MTGKAGRIIVRSCCAVRREAILTYAVGDAVGMRAQLVPAVTPGAGRDDGDDADDRQEFHSP